MGFISKGGAASSYANHLALCFFLVLGRRSLFGGATAVSQAEEGYLNVPTSDFADSLAITVESIRRVTPIFSQFANLSGDFRLSTAVSDCLDLLDSSIDDLTRSLSVIRNPKAKKHSSGNLSSDLKTWVSAAMVNAETCMDGFEGTSGVVKELVSPGIGEVISMARKLLAMVVESVNSDGDHKNGDESRFPLWVRSEEKKLMEVDGFSADAVVAADGTGNFSTVMEAVLAAPSYSMRRFVIYIKKGVYREYVEIKRKTWNLVVIGDGMDDTIITGNRSYDDGWQTFRSATFAVSGRGFIARDITFENTAGPEKHQAVALRSDSDLSVFFRCGMRGYQDTLYPHSMRQFYRECRISGTVDFIFGDGTVVFQKCLFLAREGLPKQKNVFTAQGRMDPNQPSGFSVQFCNFTAESDSTPAYLGRPWKPYSRTIILQSYMSNAIRPEGWLEYNDTQRLSTLYYAEFSNSGPGAMLASRVKWPGYHAFNKSGQVANFTVAQFIDGDLWLPATGVEYKAGFGV